jgi:cardiolipin synthase
VEVRFIYDDVGCWNLRPSFKKELRAAGVMFVPFMPVWIPSSTAAPTTAITARS